MSYIDRLQFYFKVNGITDVDVQKAIFITVIGARTYELLKSFLQPQSPQEDDVTLKAMTDKLGEHFSPRPSPITQRYKFHTRVRKPDETVTTYVAELRAIGDYCAFGDSLNAMIRDRLVCGMNNTRIQCRLLQETDLSYEAAFQKAQAMKAAAQDSSKMSEQKPPALPVHTMQKKDHSKVECYRCGGSHYANKCRFIDSECKVCGKKGHLARVCGSKEKQQSNHRNPPKGKPARVPITTSSIQLTPWTTNHVHFHLQTLKTIPYLHCLPTSNQ